MVVWLVAELLTNKLNKMKTALEKLESWIEQFYKINGTPTLDDIKGQINLLKDYETEQLIIADVSNRRKLLIDFCLKMEEKALEYKHLVPSEEFIDKYLKGNL